jgi:GNAT superfamily N-acetyltransferase
MNIRQAKPTDSGDIVRLWVMLEQEIGMVGREASDYNTQMFMLKLVNSFTDPNTYCVVLEHDEIVIGFMSGYVVPYTHGAMNVAVGDLTYILPEYRRGKEFREMLHLAIQAAKAKGCKLFDLNCIPKYKKMYEHMGFSETLVTMTKEI